MTFRKEIEKKLVDFSERGLTDKASARGHSYNLIYPKLLFKYENVENFTLLEVGTWRGHSLVIWSKLFPNGKIYGIDIDYSPLEIDPDNYDNIIILPREVKMIQMHLKDFLSLILLLMMRHTKII